MDNKRLSTVGRYGMVVVLSLGVFGTGCKALVQAGAGLEVARAPAGGVSDLASGSAPSSGESGSAPSSGIKGYVSLGEKLRSAPAELTYGFWKDVRSDCSVGYNELLRGDGSGMKIGSSQYGYFVKFPMVYQAQLSFASEDCSGEGLLSSFDYRQQILIEGVSGEPSWYGPEGFGDPNQGFFKDLPDYMMASLIKEEGGNLRVNMMSLFHDSEGRLHLSLFANSRHETYFQENKIAPEYLRKWPGDDKKFSTALRNPLWYMDLMKVDVNDGVAKAAPVEAVAVAKSSK